jgi:translation initiation factor eIF-2B subunit alpha
MYPLTQRDIVSMCSVKTSGLEAARSDLPDAVTIETAPIDLTPPEYITLLLTDLGVLTAAAVSDELIKLYQ